LSYTLGPMAWYPLRKLLAGCSFISTAFFYDSYLRQLPVLDYLTIFDKYIYCLYLWLLAGVLTLMCMLWVFRDVVQDKHAKHEFVGAEESLVDEESLYLSVGLRNDLLHMSMFCGIVTFMGLGLLFLAWAAFLPDVVFLIVLILAIWFYFWWVNVSHHRIKRKHGYEQGEAGGLAHVMSRDEVAEAKGKRFHFDLLLCCCYPPIVDICIQECCCCCGTRKDEYEDLSSEKKRGSPGNDADFPTHLYEPKTGDGGPCAICKKAGYKECIFGNRHSTPTPPASTDATTSKLTDTVLDVPSTTNQAKP